MMAFPCPQDSRKTSSASCLITWSVVALRFSPLLLWDPSAVILNVQAGSYDSPNVGCSDRGRTDYGTVAVLSKKEQGDRDSQVALSFVTVPVP